MSGDAGEAFALLAAFLSGGRLTSVVGSLERELDGSDGPGADAARTGAGMSAELLAAALLVRREVGRLNDVVHAAAISVTLPIILEPGERLANRPSLAAGNDPSRPFDVETDRRVAEFKLSVWTGHDVMRQRGVFHDLVHLASDTSGRTPELYVVGPRPIRFLRNSKSKVSWALDRGAGSTRALFERRFGAPEMSVAEFVAGPAARVRLVDIASLLPELDAVTAT